MEMMRTTFVLEGESVTLCFCTAAYVLMSGLDDKVVT